MKGVGLERRNRFRPPQRVSTAHRQPLLQPFRYLDGTWLVVRSPWLGNSNGTYFLHIIARLRVSRGHEKARNTRYRRLGALPSV